MFTSYNSAPGSAVWHVAHWQYVLVGTEKKRKEKKRKEKQNLFLDTESEETRVYLPSSRVGAPAKKQSTRKTSGDKRRGAQTDGQTDKHTVSQRLRHSRPFLVVRQWRHS